MHLSEADATIPRESLWVAIFNAHLETSRSKRITRESTIPPAPPPPPAQELLEELADMNADVMVVHRCLMDKANPNFTEAEHDSNTGA